MRRRYLGDPRTFLPDGRRAVGNKTTCIGRYGLVHVARLRTRALRRSTRVTTDPLLPPAHITASIPINAVAVVTRFSRLHNAVATNGSLLDCACERATIPIHDIPVITCFVPFPDAVPACGVPAVIAAIVRVVLIPIIALFVPFPDAVPAHECPAVIVAVVRVVLIPIIAFLSLLPHGISTHGFRRRGKGIDTLPPDTRCYVGHRARRSVRPIGLPAHVARLRGRTVDAPACGTHP